MTFLTDTKLAVACHGHSLGGALATMCAVAYGNKDLQSTLWASPRCFSPAAAEYIAQSLPRNILRIVNPCDVVTEVPPASMGWAHVGDVHQITPAVREGIGCAHILTSYLNGIDPACPVSADCQL